MYSKTIYTIILISSLFLLSSCMMLSPNHIAETHSSLKSEHSFYESIDPVCGQSIKFDNSTLSNPYLNTTYYFDTKECLKQFKEAPENYSLKKAHTRAGNHNGLLWGLGGIVMAGIMVLMVF